MASGELLALYDSEMRRDPVPEPGSRVERLGPIVRVLGKESYVIFSELDQATAPGAIAEQTEYFRHAGEGFEWKVFGHDRPENLSELLESAGYVPDEPETLLVFDLEQGF
ncbi:MAG: GNAT family N-acetyltransferase, partial [Thermoplasmata archaeon]